MVLDQLVEKLPGRVVLLLFDQDISQTGLSVDSQVIFDGGLGGQDGLERLLGTHEIVEPLPQLTEQNPGRIVF